MLLPTLWLQTFESGGNRWVCRCVADMEDAENSLSSAAMTPRGRLRVDVPSPLARLILVPALPAFHARYPDIQIDMGVSDRVVDLIGDNVDCVLRGGQITDQSLIARHVGDLQIGVYVAPSYVERLGAPAHPRELQNTDHCIVGSCPHAPVRLILWYCAVRMNVLKSRATTYLPWMMAMLTSKLG